MPKSHVKPSATLTEQIAELERIEALFQQPNLDLEEAVRQHERALTLTREIIHHLDTVESSLKKLDIRAALASSRSQPDAEMDEQTEPVR